MAAEPGLSPDVVLIAACAAARAAVAAYDAQADKDDPGDLGPLYDRERLALECVAASGSRCGAGSPRRRGCSTNAPRRRKPSALPCRSPTTR